MNWDNQLSSILSVADGSVAKMRERLTLPGKYPKGREDLFSTAEKLCNSDLDPPALPPRAPLLRQPTPSLTPGVQWADLASIQSQLQMQNKAIDSLTQRLHDLEMEKQSHHCHIQMLKEEVRSLHEELRDREESRRGQSPGAQRKLEEWRREIERELSSLRGHIGRATSLGTLEDSLGTKLHKEELQHLWRELDQLKTRLRRQEENELLQQAEARETRRQCERSCKTLEELTDSYRTHSSDLTKTLTEFSHTQQEVCQMRTTMSELKHEVRSLGLHECGPTSLLSAHDPGASPPSLPHGQTRGVRVKESDSDSEDFSPTPSLAEVSSDDLSWLDDKDPGLPARHQNRRTRLSVQSRRSDFASSDLDNSEDDDGDDLLDDELNPDLASDLSLDDL